MSKRATVIINIRTTRELRDRIDEAAKMVSATRTYFILEASRARAVETLIHFGRHNPAGHGA